MAFTPEQKVAYKERFKTIFPVAPVESDLAEVRQSFGELLAGDCDQYEGYYSIIAKDASQALKTVASVPASDLGEYLKKMSYYKDNDYFVMKSQSKKIGSRCSKDVFSLNAIVVEVKDLCTKTESWEHDIRRNKEAIIQECVENLAAREVILQPNLIIRTGNSLQFVWLLESVAVALQGMYRFVASQYAWLIEQALRENRELYRIIAPKKRGLHSSLEFRFKVLAASAKSPISMIRIPYTPNTAAKTTVDMDFYHNTRMSLRFEYSVQMNRAEQDGFVLLPAPKKPRRSKKHKGPYSLNNVAECRLESLLKLKELRGDSIRKGYRDNFCFIYMNTLTFLGFTPDDALESVQTCNDSFNHPLHPSKLNEYMEPSLRKHYNLTNDEIIYRLDITPEEQEAIGLKSTAYQKISSYKNKKRNYRNYIKKKTRDNKIIAQYKNGGTISGIAREMQLNRGTVRTVLRKYATEEAAKAEAKKEKKRLARERKRARWLEWKGITPKNMPDAPALGMGLEPTDEGMLGVSASLPAISEPPCDPKWNRIAPLEDDAKEVMQKQLSLDFLAWSEAVGKAFSIVGPEDPF